MHVRMHVCSWGFYQGRYIKILGRNNLSECPHKYLMCSISQGLQCQSVYACVCVCARERECESMCVQTVITSLLQKHQERKEKWREWKEWEDEREDSVGERKSQTAQKDVIMIIQTVGGAL